MKHILLAASLAAGALVPAAGQAASLADPYTSFWALGDSLTDNGNVFAFDPALIPSPPYFNGRVSSGRTYAEYLADAFADQGKTAENLAFAGALAQTNADLVPDLTAQVVAPFPIFADGGAGLLSRAAQFGARPLVSIFIGSNDVLGALSAGLNPSAAATAAAAVVIDQIEVMAEAGIRDFLVFTLPDFADIPRLNTQSVAARTVATLGATTFNADLATGIAGLDPLLGADVMTVDVFAALKGILGDPDALGLTNTTDACLTFGQDPDGNPIITGLCPNADEYAFFDDIHPTGTTHAALAAAATQVLIAPIPLPAAGWALIAGLGLLAGVARRRAA